MWIAAGLAFFAEWREPGQGMAPLGCAIDAEPCEEPEPMHARNTLLAGTSLVSGEAKTLLFATGSHSAFGKIAQLTQATADTISPLHVEIVRVSRFVAGLALALGVIFFFIG